MSREISKYDDIIDSRDIIERIEELEADRDAHNEACDDPDDARFATERWEDANPEEAKELASLLALQEEAEGYSEDWQHGATLIRDSYFETYARELADDIGALKEATEWPGRHIDWTAAAEELKQDYTEVSFDGVAYWIR